MKQSLNIGLKPVRKTVNVLQQRRTAQLNLPSVCSLIRSAYYNPLGIMSDSLLARKIDSSLAISSLVPVTTF